MLDSDVQNADAALHVEFYKFNSDPYRGQDFIRIMVPGDQLNVIEQPVKEHHKVRFTRQWLHYQMQQNGKADPTAIGGIPLTDWHAQDPAGLHEVQLGELQIMKFSTVEQVATATDAQLQKIVKESMKSLLTKAEIDRLAAITRNNKDSIETLAAAKTEIYDALGLLQTIEQLTAINADG